ncbi:MAG: carboxypeptidase regulatory-like domain-containing protein [Thermoanaerobaculia bacterium]
MSPALYALTYRVEMKSGAAAVREVTLCAARIDGEAQPIRRQITVPSNGEIAVAEGTWELRIESDDVWSPPAYASFSGVASLVTVPAAHIRAAFARADEFPAGVTVRMTPADPQFAGEKFRADIPCSVQNSEMHCTAPAGRYDLRIMPKGFLPQFRWNIELAPAAITKLEPIALLKGAALIGTVRQRDGGMLPADARVTLAPGPATPVRPNAKGFFEFTSVPPGEYVLTASAKSLTSETRSVVVVANRTAELNAPLVLDTPKRVRATIMPPRDPDGVPWLLELARERTSNDYDKVTSGSVDREGAWEQQRLRNGNYVLSILRRDGGQWASEKFSIDGTDVDLVVPVPGDRIEGSVAFGDQPIAARLTFGGEYGAVRQIITAADDGSFSGVLPPMKNERWDVFIDATVPPMRRTLTGVQGRRDADGILHFDVVLPRTAVLGTVLGTDGAPAAGAIVNMLTLPEGTIDQTYTGPDGSFQFSGLAPGRYRVSAEDYLVKSEVVELEMTEVDPPALRLAMKDIQLLKGRVLTNGSNPVIGTNVTAVSWSSGPPWEQLTAQSNEAGAFVLRVPPGSSTLDLIIAPPGFATTMARMPVRTDMEMHVLADQHGGSLVADVPADPQVKLAHGDANLWLSFVTEMGRGTVAPDERGRHRVTIPSLQAGRYDLCLGAHCVSGEVPPHGTLTLSLE